MTCYAKGRVCVCVCMCMCTDIVEPVVMMCVESLDALSSQEGRCRGTTDLTAVILRVIYTVHYSHCCMIYLFSSRREKIH
jgi:hypothetical protein